MNVPATDPPHYHGIDYFPIHGRVNSSRGQVNAVNFNYILRTGDIRAYETNPADYPNQSLYTLEYCPHEDDMKCALENIRARVVSTLLDEHKNPRIKRLLDKDVWTKSDREVWEEILSDTVSRMVNEEPGFEVYRSKRGEDITRVQNLNEVSELSAMDCEVYAAVEGSVIQLVENHILRPYETCDPSLWKQPLSYFRASGGVTEAYPNLEDGYRYVADVYIVTPAGNIIAPTHDPDQNRGTPYRKSAYSLELLARGEPAYVADGDKVYGAYTGGRYDWTEHAAIRADLPAREHLSNVQLRNVIYAEDGLFALECRETKDGHRYIPLKKMDIGTPHERYVPLDDKSKDNGKYTFRYEDALSGYTYRFKYRDGEAVIQRYRHSASVFDSEYWWQDVTDDVNSPDMGAVHDKCTEFRDNLAVGMPAETLSMESANTPQVKQTL